MTMVGLQWQRRFYVASSTRATQRQNAVIVVVFALLLTLVAMFFSAKVAFPMPFALLCAIPITIPPTIVLLVFFFKRNVNKTIHGTVSTSQTAASCQEANAIQAHQQMMLTSYKKLFLFNISIIFVYSAYMVGSRKLNGNSQLVYIMLLLVVKAVLIEFARIRLDHVGDLVAASTVFSVEMSNAMFVSLCMGGANSSMASSALIMAIDISHIGFCMSKLVRRSRTMARIIRSNRGLGQRVSFENLVEWSIAFAQAHRDQLVKVQGIRLEASSGIRFVRPKLNQLKASEQKTHDQSISELLNSEYDVQEESQSDDSDVSEQISRDAFQKKTQLLRETRKLHVCGRVHRVGRVCRRICAVHDG